jgi:c-di-GMP-binding flagellar brake protein YcgR
MNNRREHRRYKVAVAAEILLRGETVEGETRDISEGGTALVLDHELPDGSTVALTLILTQDGIEDPDSQPFEASASVMWAAPTDDGRHMMVLRFKDVAPAAAEQLRGFLRALTAS